MKNRYWIGILTAVILAAGYREYTRPSPAVCVPAKPISPANHPEFPYVTGTRTVGGKVVWFEDTEIGFNVGIENSTEKVAVSVGPLSKVVIPGLTGTGPGRLAVRNTVGWLKQSPKVRIGSAGVIHGHVMEIEFSKGD